MYNKRITAYKGAWLRFNKPIFIIPACELRAHRLKISITVVERLISHNT